jgi:Protein of unknown function (DUF2911)
MRGFPAVAVYKRLVSFVKVDRKHRNFPDGVANRIVPLLVLLLLLANNLATAQAGDSSQSESAVCRLEDGRQMSVRYTPVANGRNDAAFGKVWTPGGNALTLFTEMDVSVNGKTLPLGAYTMYLIPGKKSWTAIVSRNTNVSAKYDEKDDLARASMETGELSQPEPGLKVFFGHTGPKTCEFNVDYGKTRAWVEFKER